MARLGIGLLLVAVVAAGLYLFFKPTSQIISTAENSQSEEAQVAEQIVESAKPQVASDWQPPQLMADSYESSFGPLPSSLKGTRIPFDLLVDENNHLIITSSLRRLFDYFFTLVGEEEIPQIIQRLEELLSNHLPQPAADDALDILNQYISLKEGEMALREQMAVDYQAQGKQVDLQERVRLLRELRQSVLSPEVYDAFFGEEDQRAQYSLQRHDILRDESLSEQEKTAALRELDQQLPEHIRLAKEEEYQSQDLMAEIRKARANGASEASILQMRTEVYGAETAERFAQADQAQSQWDSRVEAYRVERRAVLDSPLSQEDQETEIQSLREQHFQGPELLRIPVIDRMWDDQGKP